MDRNQFPILQSEQIYKLAGAYPGICATPGDIQQDKKGHILETER
ncbi:MAG: hypothetical protein AB9861_08700 [Methanosarcina sp.]|jgi:hypothetical protein